MSGSFRLFAVVTVLTVGACGASLFRKPVATTTAEPAADRLTRRWDSGPAAGTPRIVSGPTWVAESPAHLASEPTRRRAPTAILGDAASPEPPELPAASPIGNPIGPFSLASGRGGESQEESGGEPRRLPGAVRMHHVEDGDTLGSLALRYLGDANRGGEIVELNRGVVGPGGALPIGADLEIPDRNAKPARSVDSWYREAGATAEGDANASGSGILPGGVDRNPPSVPVEMGVIRPSRERAAP